MPVSPALLEGIDDLRALVEGRRPSGAVGFVPTMGALHAGHAALIEQARRECATVVVSIFVNPLQFDRPDDLERYPRTMGDDIDLCERLGVDCVFAPHAAAVYPRPQICTVDVGRLADHLCGRYRPGHFRGVATVVLKLLEMVRPDVAYFGEKDAQQLAIVRRMVADFNLPVRIAAVATVRDDDGLALSSRNQRLSPQERRLAPSLFRALALVREQVAAGVTDPVEIKSRAIGALPSDGRLSLEYLELVDEDEFQPVARVDGPVVAAGALWVGATRLIDNVRCTPPGRS